MVFELPFLEKQYTKRDAFVLMECDSERYSNSNQILASFSLWKKSDFTLKFVNDWLQYAQNERIITDIKNDCGFPDFDEFIDHRHDQSIFSLLSKKYDLKVYRNPSEHGNEYKAVYQNSKYDQLIVHTRKKNSWILVVDIIDKFLFKFNFIWRRFVNIFRFNS